MIGGDGVFNYQNFKLYNSFQEALSHATVLNVLDLFTTFCFELPHEISSALNLVSIRESTIEDIIDAVDIDNKSPKPWIDVNTSALDSSIGAHVYVFEFNNTVVDRTVNLYSAYIIRNDNPDKRYIYMKRETDGCDTI